MLKCILYFFIFCVPFVVDAQDSTRVEQYCQVVATGVFFTGKVSITIDYGQEHSGPYGDRLRDSRGKLMKFNSVMDALNYLGKDGWKLVNAVPLLEATGPRLYQYLFKKEVAVTDVQ